MPLAAHGVWQGDTLVHERRAGRCRHTHAAAAAHQVSAAVVDEAGPRAGCQRRGEQLRAAGAAGYLPAAEQPLPARRGLPRPCRALIVTRPRPRPPWVAALQALGCDARRCR
jgi:hypothetical protein